MADSAFETQYVGERRKMAGKHPGFKAVAAGMARRQGISKARAAAELAVGTRRASASAKRANPNLKRVRG